MKILIHQYALIVERRETLFSYCESLQPDHFVETLDCFGGRSMSYLLGHVANTYHFWLGDFPKLQATAHSNAHVKSVSDCRHLFEGTNQLVNHFLRSVGSDPGKEIVGRIAGRDIELKITPLQLFTHVITHEYHHKGQILSMSRQLGYIPVDTDLIRFD